ncbi:cutinase, partial [Rhizodiscina lignyota]
GTDTENQLVDGDPCTDLVFLFARATSESGNVGTFVGEPVIAAMRQAVGADKLLVQGLDYPAAGQGIPDGRVTSGESGGQMMFDLVNQAISTCPNSLIALGGYSQGSGVVHVAAEMSGFPTSKINSVILTGDPYSNRTVGQIPQAAVFDDCHCLDNVCNGTQAYFNVSPQHQDYNVDTQALANFVLQKAGLS